jgi:hypothetical protein
MDGDEDETALATWLPTLQPAKPLQHCTGKYAYVFASTWAGQRVATRVALVPVEVSVLEDHIRETTIACRLSDLVRDGKTPHFPIVHDVVALADVPVLDGDEEDGDVIASATLNSVIDGRRPLPTLRTRRGYAMHMELLGEPVWIALQKPAFAAHALPIVRAITMQVLHGLCVARGTYNFYHFDLHAGNVLLQLGTPADDEVWYKFTNGRRACVPTHGVRVKIIDFNLGVMVGCSEAHFCAAFKIASEYAAQVTARAKTDVRYKSVLPTVFDVVKFLSSMDMFSGRMPPETAAAVRSVLMTVEEYAFRRGEVTLMKLFNTLMLQWGFLAAHEPPAGVKAWGF